MKEIKEEIGMDDKKEKVESVVSGLLEKKDT